MEIKTSEESMKIKISEESTEESMEIKCPEEDKNMTDWYDKNKFKKILATVNRNKFSHKNEIGKLKYMKLKTWLIILTKIQLVKYLLKKI